MSPGEKSMGTIADGFRRGLCAVALAILIQGCSTPTRPPVSEIGEHGRYHTVRKGETLYSIAWRYGLDYHAVARHNKIGPPYTIFAGQRLILRPEARTAVAGATRDTAPPGQSGAGGTAAVKKPATPNGKTGAPAPAIARTPSLPASFSWAWPLSGEVLQPFSLSEKLNKGIDIAARAGDVVKAAAPGVVVYAGGNLRGYGKLVIIKHSDQYLSAYGNNRVIRVREGQQVKQGQEISEVGLNPANVALLHFEIRRDGKPEDPLRYLPGR